MYFYLIELDCELLSDKIEPYVDSQIASKTELFDNVLFGYPKVGNQVNHQCALSMIFND
jgi:hypothetical protein